MINPLCLHNSDVEDGVKIHVMIGSCDHPRVCLNESDVKMIVKYSVLVEWSIVIWTFQSLPSLAEALLVILDS